MDYETYLPFLFFALGVIGRVLIPYIQARIAAEGALSFDWRFIVGELITAGIALIPLVAGVEFLDHVGSLSWLAAILYGWGASDLGRTIQKAVGK